MSTFSNRVIVVVGSDGMLGGMLCRVAAERGLETVKIGRSHVDACAPDAVAVIDRLLPPRPALVVNCIAVTKPANDVAGMQALFSVNSLFPRKLASCLRPDDLMVQISTDGVFPSSQKTFVETDLPDPPDAYGLSKLLGEQDKANVLNIRTSIVGPEWKSPTRSLLEWVLSQPRGAAVDGFTNHIWQGVTTKQLAAFCCELANEERFGALRDRTAILHYTPNEAICKFDLVSQIAETFEHPLEVRPVEAATGRTRTLSSLYDAEIGTRERRAIRTALRDLPAYRVAVVH